VNHEVVALDRRFLEWKEDSKIDPETALSFGLFKSAMSWAELTKRRRVVILAEGGSGKTTEIKCRHQHSLSFISASCRQRAVFQVQNRHRGAESVVFAVFSAALYPWIATSTVDKKADGDNHY
jgi:hypothetical protein